MISHYWLFVLRERSELWKGFFVSDIPMKTPLIPLPRIRYKERRTPSLRIGTRSDMLETIWINRVGAGAHPIPPDSEALSQWLTCYNRFITTTDTLCQLVSRTVRARQPFSQSPSSPFLYSTWWKRRNTWHQSREGKTLKQDLLEKKT